MRLPWRRGARRGEPASGNGASSLHLLWEVPAAPLIAASAVLEVLRTPEAPRLVFWALQVTFSDGARHRGGAHLGLQWNPGFPACTAANWGGYAPAEIGGLLSGSESALPSVRVDDNTRDFDWKVGRRYRLEIAKAPHPPAGLVAWRGTITDLDEGVATVVRDLYTDAEHLLLPMVWTESFLRCDHPGVAARWSEFAVTLSDGAVVHPRRLMVNYQAPERGGCSNSSVRQDDTGIVQETGVKRLARQGKVLTLQLTADR